MNYLLPLYDKYVASKQFIQNNENFNQKKFQEYYFEFNVPSKKYRVDVC